MGNEELIIPSDNEDLEAELKNNKDMYMEHIYEIFLDKIKIDVDIPKRIPLFNFKNTTLQVIVKAEHFHKTLFNLLDYYVDLEEYEKCNKIKSIINRINN